MSPVRVFLSFRSDYACNGVLKPREQMNGYTAFIDGSQIYGSDKNTSDALRTKTKGLLKTHNQFLKVPNLPTRKQCGFPITDRKKAEDLVAGDVRVTEQPSLASIQTLFLNEHNRIANGLEPLFMKSSAFKKMEQKEQDEFIFQVCILLVVSPNTVENNT